MISNHFLTANEQVHTFCRDASPVSHLTWCSTKRSSAAPGCKSPCPLLPCRNTGQSKWPFCILVWGIHHWLLSGRVLDEWDHLSVAVWQSLGGAVTIWGFCLCLNTSLLHRGMTLVFEERRIIINLQTSNIHKTGRNFSGQLWEFSSLSCGDVWLWCSLCRTKELAIQGEMHQPWGFTGRSGNFGNDWRIREPFFFLSEGPV